MLTRALAHLLIAFIVLPFTAPFATVDANSGLDRTVKCSTAASDDTTWSDDRSAQSAGAWTSASIRLIAATPATTRTTTRPNVDGPAHSTSSDRPTRPRHQPTNLRI
jgi:hypothetical protein